MQLAIHHETRFDYSEPLSYAHQTLCLTPEADAHQQVRRWQLQVPGTLFAQRDGYGNRQHSWTLERRLLRGVVRAHGLVATNRVCEWQEPRPVTPAPIYLRGTPLTEPDGDLADLGRRHLPRQPDTEAVLALARAVVDAVRYRHGSTDVTTTARQALAQGEGVCQDHAHVMIAACRTQGVAARYVSGYFYAPEAPRLASHAWVDVCLDPQAGRWVSVDPTHRCLMDERHVRLAVGPDYLACSPIRGVRSGGGDEAMDVLIRIVPEPESLAGAHG